MFITDGALFHVEVDGTDLKIGSDLLEEAHVIEHTDSNKPSLVVRYFDNKLNALASGIFRDGAVVKVTMGDGHNTPRTWSFQQYGLEHASPKSAGDLIELSGVADILPYFTSTVKGAHKGNASDVITKMAQQFNIPLIDVDPTQDMMLWRADNRTAAQWVRKIVDHAWMGEGSSPLKAMTSNGGQWMLRVKDILKVGSATTQLISAGLPGAGSNGSTILYDHSLRSQGGALNSFANYGLKLVANNLGGGVEDLLNINVKALTQSLGVSSTLQQAVGIAQTIFTPAAHGNAHDNYQRAFHANTKSRALFSTEVRTLAHDMTSLKLLDDVEALLATARGDLNSAFSMAYKVCGITRSVARGNYTESHTLTATGQNSGGGS